MRWRRRGLFRPLCVEIKPYDPIGQIERKTQDRVVALLQGRLGYADLGNRAQQAKAATKRPDVVLYVNGIALAVLELKRSTVSVAEGIRQNLDNQKKEFIQPFFSTLQWLMAGNDSEGLRYATIETPEKYWLQYGGRQHPPEILYPCAFLIVFVFL